MFFLPICPDYDLVDIDFHLNNCKNYIHEILIKALGFFITQIIVDASEKKVSTVFVTAKRNLSNVEKYLQWVDCALVFFHNFSIGLKSGE